MLKPNTSNGNADMPFPTAAVPSFSVERNPLSNNADHSTESGSDCDRLAEALSAYLDHELDSDDRLTVETHLSGCPKCADSFAALRKTDTLTQREWRDNAPLPSSLQRNFAIDSIMEALPPVPAAPTAFAPRRIHAKSRWTRFAAGIAGVLTLIGLLWTSYRLGYAQGRSSQPFVKPVHPSFTPDALRPETQSRLPSVLFAQRSARTMFAAPAAVPISHAPLRFPLAFR